MSGQQSESGQPTAQPATNRRGLLIGAGYFSGFHLDAWQRIERAEIVCVCDLDQAKAKLAADQYGVADFSGDVDAALSRSDIDFIDIATGPTNRLELVEQAIARKLPIICQKPLANDFKTAAKILELAESSNITFMVHENFRFQPWYREMKRLIDDGVIGQQLHSIHMRTRTGDGWGTDAYLARQPYFRTMPRLLIQETGVHFVDTFRFLGGEVTNCSASLQRCNDAIVGEDATIMTLRLQGGAMATWDANRYNESNDQADPRYTFGEMWIDGDEGSMRLATDGTISIRRLGEAAYEHSYDPPTNGFAGDCVHACQSHFMDVLDGRAECETSPREYLKTLRVVEAAYQSHSQGRRIGVTGDAPSRRSVVDLSLPVTNEMPGVDISSCKTIASEGWNATTLKMYSHSGTHIDAPVHFVPEGDQLDHQDLSVCIGPARLVRLPHIGPSAAISVADVVDVIGEAFAGDRLILQTNWHRRFGTPTYRDELPRISQELAEWLVSKRVALVGVEPPSVADVNNIDELTQVHQTLFRGGVVIVEGLANLDQIPCEEFEFVALPLKIVGGDGCPVRAIAIVDAGPV